MNVKAKKFDPDYCVLPGLTVCETMQAKESTVGTIANQSGTTQQYVWGVIAGTESITEEFAQSLEKILGPPASFWNNLQRTFDEGKAAGKSITGWGVVNGEPCIPVTLCSARNKGIYGKSLAEEEK